MPEATRPIAVIPSDCFRWQPRVQFIDSFRTREAALNCAFEHGYNLIVERNEGSSALFDVLDDPNRVCTADLELELLQTEEILVDPYAGGWTSLMLLSLWHLARRLSTTVAGVCIRVIVPRLRHAACSSRLAIGRTAHHLRRRITSPSSGGTHRPAWYPSIPRSCKVKTFSLSTARLHIRRIATRAAAVYHRQVVPFYRSAASRCWWSNTAVALRRGWHRHSQGTISDAARSLAAEVSFLYARKIVPFCASATSRCWWSTHTIALRRGWHRYSQGTITAAARRIAAEGSVLYAREAMPRLRYAVSRCRQADIQGTCRRAWANTISAASDLARRFAAAVAGFYVAQAAPRLREAVVRYRQAKIQAVFRRAWNSTVLTAIRLTDRFAVAIAHFYVRGVAPRLHRAAVHYQQADIEGALRRSMEAVAPPHQSNASQLH